MIETTIAICPPEGARRTLCELRIENCTPDNEQLADYRVTAVIDGQEHSAILQQYSRDLGPLFLVVQALREIDSKRTRFWVDVDSSRVFDNEGNDTGILVR